MSDTVKLIIEIPKAVKQEFDKIESIALKGAYFDLDGIIGKAIQNGTPISDVISIDKANAMIKSYVSHYEENIHGEWLKSDIPESILSKCSVCGFNLGAYSFNFCPMCGADMRGESCNTCKNNDDELSGECYECVKGIQNHYEPKRSEPNE